MALTANYTREPVEHGDSNVYHNYVMQSVRGGGKGGLSIEASNSGGSLRISKGFAGIDDTTTPTKGMVEVTTAGNVSVASGTANLWHAVEYSVSGTSVTFYVTALAGETDESFISLTMKGYYDESKQGYYRIASRRIIGFVFLRAALALGRIVNCESGKMGFKGVEIKSYFNISLVESKKYYDTIYFIYQHWNMDTTSFIDLNIPYYITGNIQYKANNLSGTIMQDMHIDAGLVSIMNLPGPVIRISRVTGGYFDGATYNDSTIILRVDYET